MAGRAAAGGAAGGPLLDPFPQATNGKHEDGGGDTHERLRYADGFSRRDE